MKLVGGDLCTSRHVSCFTLSRSGGSISYVSIETYSAAMETECSWKPRLEYWKVSSWLKVGCGLDVDVPGRWERILLKCSFIFVHHQLLVFLLRQWLTHKPDCSALLVIYLTLIPIWHSTCSRYCVQELAYAYHWVFCSCSTCTNCNGTAVSFAARLSIVDPPPPVTRACVLMN